VIIESRTILKGRPFSLPAEELGRIVGAPGGRQFGVRGDWRGRRVCCQRILDPVTAVYEFQWGLWRNSKLKAEVRLSDHSTITLSFTLLKN
jgi:hypothetical protein